MQRIIGVVLGAIVTYGLLIVFAGGAQSQAYLTAIVAGLIVAILWPWFINLVVASRVKEKSREQIDREVEARMADKNRVE